MTKRIQRTDPHRPGAIVPADYTYLFSYNGATVMDGWPIPAFRFDCQADLRREEVNADGKHVRFVNGTCPEGANGRCCVLAAQRMFGVARTGPFQCSVCGTRFIYGDVWLHEPTQEIIHIGHECAAKYEMMADRSEWEMAHGRHREAAAKAIEKKQREEDRAAFLAEHEGLADALAAASLGDVPEHVRRARGILEDLADRFRLYCTLTPKQVALALRLGEQVRNPPEPEVYTDAPTGRVTFRGRIVSVKAREGAYGIQMKMTVRVEASDGIWLAWGTCPQQLLDAQADAEFMATGPAPDLRGALVEVTATLKAGRDPHFALMSRPRGSVVKWGPRTEVAA